MANERFRCRHCGKLKARRTADQRYCGEPACQKARKNAWRRERYAADPEYRLNQRDSTKAWLEANGGAAAYYRRYRNGCKKRQDEAPPADAVTTTAEYSAPGFPQGTTAKSDAFSQKSLAISGRYELIPLGGAKSDAFQAEIRVISGH